MRCCRRSGSSQSRTTYPLTQALCRPEGPSNRPSNLPLRRWLDPARMELRKHTLKPAADKFLAPSLDETWKDALAMEAVQDVSSEPMKEALPLQTFLIERSFAFRAHESPFGALPCVLQLDQQPARGALLIPSPPAEVPVAYLSSSPPGAEHARANLECIHVKPLARTLDTNDLVACGNEFSHEKLVLLAFVKGTFRNKQLGVRKPKMDSISLPESVPPLDELKPGTDLLEPEVMRQLKFHYVSMGRPDVLPVNGDARAALRAGGITAEDHTLIPAATAE
jgi:hypothetical protein